MDDEIVTQSRKFVDDLDKYKLQWESYTHWFARKTFLRHNWEKFENKTKLIALSNVYANHHFMGNRYSAEVMKQVGEMEEGMTKARELLTTAESYMTGSLIERTPTKTNDEMLQKMSMKLPVGMKPMIFVKESKTETLNHSFNNLTTNDNVCSEGNEIIDTENCKKSVKNEYFTPKQANKAEESMEVSTQEKIKTKVFSNENVTPQSIHGSNGVIDCKPFNLMKLVNKPNTYTKIIDKKMNSQSDILRSEKSLKHHANDEMCKNPTKQQKNQIMSLSTYIHTSVDEFEEKILEKFNQYSQQAIKKNPSFVCYQFKGRYLKIYSDWAKAKNIQERFNASTWFCDLFISDVFVAHGHGTGKNLAKLSAVKGAIHILSSSKVFVVSAKRSLMDGSFIWQVCASLSPQSMKNGTLPPIENVEPEFQSTTVAKKIKQNEPVCKPSLKISQSLITAKFHNFVIREKNDSTPISIVSESAQFNHLPFEYDTTPHIRGSFTEWQCIMSIDGVQLGLGLNCNQKSAKHEAASDALNNLKKVCPTIFVSRPGNQADALSRNDITGKNGAEAARLDESNLGNQLLRKMGWSGVGGLGKYGEGRSEPVQVFQLQDRAGLGNQSANQEKGIVSFKDAQTVLKQYVADGCQGELTFSPELSSDERKVIHKIARKYHLTSKSFGKDDARYLVVFQKVANAQSIVEDLIDAGGKKGGMELINPWAN